MLTFCPECGSLLQIEEGRQVLQFGCPTCPYICPVTKLVSSKTYPKLKDLDEVLGGPSAWESAQCTDERCPTCGHGRAYFMQLQTRSADEPMTTFYRCANVDYMLSEIFGFFETLIFISFWTVLLYSSFVVIRSLVVDRLPSHPLLHVFIPMVITSSLLFELAHRYDLARQGASCSNWFTVLIFTYRSSCPDFSLWSLNPFQIVASLLGDLIVLASSICGRSAAAFISSFFEGLPWLLAIPSVFIVVFFLLAFILALFGYQFSLGYGFIKIQPGSRKDSSKNSASMSQPKANKANESYYK